MPFFFLFARLRVFTDVHYSPLWFRNLKLCLKDMWSSFVIIIIMYRLYSATLLKDPAALYNKSDINMDSAWVTFEEEFERYEETSAKIRHQNFVESLFLSFSGDVPSVPIFPPPAPTHFLATSNYKGKCMNNFERVIKNT